MAESSTRLPSAAFPMFGIVRERLGKAKREGVDAALGKGESWTTKVLNDQCGVMLDDIPRLLAELGLKIVSKDKVCVDRDVANAMATLHAKMAPRMPELLWDNET